MSRGRSGLEASWVQTHALLTVTVRNWSAAVSAFLGDGVAPSSMADGAATSSRRPRPAQDRIAGASVRQAAAASATYAPPAPAPSAERLLQKKAYVYINTATYLSNESFDTKDQLMKIMILFG